MVVHTFNPNMKAGRQTDLCEFEVSLVYRFSSGTSRAVTPRNTIPNNKHKKAKPKGVIKKTMNINCKMVNKGKLM